MRQYPVLQISVNLLDDHLLDIPRYGSHPVFHLNSRRVVGDREIPTMGPIEVLRAMFTEELDGRKRSVVAARRNAAGFPAGKNFDSWDPGLSTIPFATQQSLRTLKWVHRNENLPLAGPSGTGKTFFLEALGQQAITDGLKVAWFTLEQLAGIVRSQRVDDSVGKAVKKVLRVDLIIIDGIGLLPVPQDVAEALYRVVDTAYEKRSLTISSNRHPSGV